MLRVGWSIFFRLFIGCSEVSAVAGRRKWKVYLPDGRAAAALLLAAAFAVGSVAGCVAAGVVRDPSGELTGYVRNYLSLAAEASLVPRFGVVLWRTARLALAVVALGFTAVGLVGIPALFLCKGFALCYAVSAFYRFFGTAGLAPALILFGLSAFVWLPALLELGVRGLLGAYGLLRRAAGDGRYPLGRREGALVRYGICVLALLACAGVEYAVVPTLLREIAGAFLSG